MSTGRFRAYLKPFDLDGNYTTWRDISADVDMGSLGTIKRALENNDYSLGVFRTTNLSVRFRNVDGTYSDVDVLQSVFRYKRSATLFKLTWEINPEPALCGFVEAGNFQLSEEVVVFTGLLDDTGTVQSASDQMVTFQVLGRESLFSAATVPFSGIANGDLISDVIFACLNQAVITDHLGVTVENIAPNVDVALDDVSSLENKTVKEALDELLVIGNSVLHIEDDTIYVSAREPSAALKQTFYGQASSLGAENLVNVDQIRNGMHRLTNLLVWRDSAVISENIESLEKFGVKKREIDSDLITDDTKQQTVLDARLAEFVVPKQELEIETPVTYDTLARALLDRVNIDYPTVFVATETDLPICGLAVCGEAALPKGLWSLTLETEQEFKVLSADLNVKDSMMKFQLRAV